MGVFHEGRGRACGSAEMRLPGDATLELLIEPSSEQGYVMLPLHGVSRPDARRHPPGGSEPA